MYGTLPKSTRTKTKHSKEEYAKMIVEKILKEKNQVSYKSINDLFFLKIFIF